MSPRNAATGDRQARRKAETRARLVDAARRVFARQGVEATRINEITEEADVGFGSFYNHFEGKDDIAAAVMERAAAEAGAAIDEATADVADPAEVVAVAHRSLIRRAAEDRELAWLMVRLDVSHDVLWRGLGGYAVRDLQRGIDSGRFQVDDRDVALTAAGGALLGVLRAVLEGRLGADAAEAHAAGVLRLFGVAADEAREIASRPLA